MSGLQRSLLCVGPLEVDREVVPRRVQLDRASWIDVGRAWLRGADDLFEALVAEVPWRQGRRRMYGRDVDDPRLSRWYRPDDPLPHPVLVDVRDALAARYGVGFGAVGLNYYRDGSDSVAPHADRELRDVDVDSIVAIVTLGARRPFLVRRREGGPSRDLAPASGDLVVMGGRCQRGWVHGVPKVATSGPRISVSLRWCGAAPGVA